MAQHTWKELDSFPIIFVVVFATGIFVPCIIALTNGHVTPYVPYISEGGGEFPEAGIFSIFMSLSACLCQWIIFLRYLVVEELNSVIGNDTNNFLNKIALALGCFASVALIVVASYPAPAISQVHNSAAGASTVSYVSYLICHTWISFRILGKTRMSYCRLVMMVISIVSLICITTFGLIGSSEWTADYWSGKKTPEDKGFVAYVISCACEWILAFLFIAYFSTFISEFKKSSLHFKMEITGRNQSKPRLTNIDIRPRRA